MGLEDRKLCVYVDINEEDMLISYGELYLQDWVSIEYFMKSLPRKLEALKNVIDTDRLLYILDNVEGLADLREGLLSIIRRVSIYNDTIIYSDGLNSRVVNRDNTSLPEGMLLSNIVSNDREIEFFKGLDSYSDKVNLEGIKFYVEASEITKRSVVYSFKASEYTMKDACELVDSNTDCIEYDSDVVTSVKVKGLDDEDTTVREISLLEDNTKSFMRKLNDKTVSKEVD